MLRSWNSLRILPYQGREFTSPRSSRRDVLPQDDRNVSPGASPTASSPGETSVGKGLHCKSVRRPSALSLADFVRRPLPTASPASPRRRRRGRPSADSAAPRPAALAAPRSWGGGGAAALALRRVSQNSQRPRGKFTGRRRRRRRR